jgi:hypothetical protein
MAFSLPGIMREERMTVSFSSTEDEAVIVHRDARKRRHRLACEPEARTMILRGSKERIS